MTLHIFLIVVLLYLPAYFHFTTKMPSDQKPNDNWCFLNVLFFHKRQPPKHKKCVVIFVKDKMQMMETTQLILLYFTSHITKITIVALILVHILLIIAKAAMRCAFVHSTCFCLRNFSLHCKSNGIQFSFFFINHCMAI